MGVGVEPKAEHQRAGGLARRGRAPAMIGLPDGEDSGVTDLGSGGQEGPARERCHGRHRITDEPRTPGRDVPGASAPAAGRRKFRPAHSNEPFILVTHL